MRDKDGFIVIEGLTKLVMAEEVDDVSKRFFDIRRIVREYEDKQQRFSYDAFADVLEKIERESDLSDEVVSLIKGERTNANHGFRQSVSEQYVLFFCKEMEWLNEEERPPDVPESLDAEHQFLLNYIGVSWAEHNYKSTADPSHFVEPIQNILVKRNNWEDQLKEVRNRLQTYREEGLVPTKSALKEIYNTINRATNIPIKVKQAARNEASLVNKQNRSYGYGIPAYGEVVLSRMLREYEDEDVLVNIETVEIPKPKKIDIENLRLNDPSIPWKRRVGTLCDALVETGEEGAKYTHAEIRRASKAIIKNPGTDEDSIRDFSFQVDSLSFSNPNDCEMDPNVFLQFCKGMRVYDGKL